MTEFYLVRHGQTEYNCQGKIQGRIDTPLNKTGILQAHELGKYFLEEGLKFDKVITSPLRRAYATGIIIEGELGMGDCIIDEALSERLFGPLEGEPVSNESFAKINSDSIDGCEKSYEIIERIKTAILRLANEYKNQKVLVVTHSHVIKALAVYVDKNKYHFDDPLYNCGLSIFKSDGKIIKIAAFNKKTV